MHSPLVITFLALAGVASSVPFRHIYSLDMSIQSENCPSALRLFHEGGLRTCGKRSNGRGCDSITISTGGQGYREVSGKIVGYQYGSPDAFGANINDINSHYVDGISITHGRKPNRQHIWTYAIAVRQNFFTGASDNGNTCPSTGYGRAPPTFVGKNYFCSSASTTKHWAQILYPNTPLWSNILGDCATCEDNVKFCTKLPRTTTDNLEIRVCTNNYRSNEDIRIQSMDFWVR